MQKVRLGVVLLALGVAMLAQQRPAPTIPREPLGPGPFTFDTAEQHKIRVSIVTKGLSHPWGLVFLPDRNMLVTERDGRWTSAEVSMTRSLGYGTYSFDLRDTSQLDPATALSLFTFDLLGADQNYREMTVDVSRGDPVNMNGQYVVQPETVPANVFRFAIPASAVTHSFRWEPGRVSFKTVRRAGQPRAEVVAERLFTAGVPSAGTEHSHMTLLYDRAAPKPPSKAVEVVVEKFAFLP